MEGKLRSISRRIHWSLLLKAAVFAAAWFFLPFWAFALISLYLYFSPWFRPGKLAVPFLALLLLAYIQPAPSFGAGLWYSLIFGVIFYCVLLVKDLLVLDRRSLYEIIALALVFFYLRDLYSAFNQGIGDASGAALFYAFLVAAMIALLLRNFLAAFPEEGDATVRERALKRTGTWLVFLISAQLCIAGLFLPLNFIYQSAIIFILAAFAIDIVAAYLLQGPSGIARSKIFGVASAVFVFLVIILASAQWGL